MKGNNVLMDAVQKGMKFYNEHQREFMLGFAIGGEVLTLVTAVRAGMKAERLRQAQQQKMDAIERQLEDGLFKSEEEYNKAKKELTKETVKKGVMIFAAPALATSGTITATCAGYKVASGQIATLAAVHKMSQEAMQDIKQKTEEIAGPKKAQQIRDEANIEGMKRAYENGGDIVETGKGNVLFYDKYCGRFFRSSWESIRSAVNNINRDWNDGMYDDEVPYNELANEYGLSADSVFGDAFVFRKDDRFKYGSNIELLTSTGQLETKIYPGTMESATVIDYYVPPQLADRYRRRN